MTWAIVLIVATTTWVFSAVWLWLRTMGPAPIVHRCRCRCVVRK
jgi:uncharacterized membrane protein YeiB